MFQQMKAGVWGDVWDGRILCVRDSVSDPEDP
jgi:hypothetical protein